MNRYLCDLRYILENGKRRDDRTGTGTIGLFGMQTRYNLRNGFPAPTSKKLAWKGVVSELLWFLEGNTDERRLAEIRFEKPRAELADKTTIWTENADNQGVALGYENTPMIKELGPVYGFQWRFWGNDQIAKLINDLQNNPNSRRHILSAWNANEVEFMALPPCHCLAQFHVQDGELSCQLYQRSADFFLGVPFNIASYSLLTHMLAQICDLKVGDFIHTIGDAHVYSNHVEQAEEQLSRTTRKAPTLKMPAFTTLEELLETKTSDYELENYNPHPNIKAPMAV